MCSSDLAFLVAVVMPLSKQTLATSRPALEGDLTRAMGQQLLTRYVLPFELLAVLLLAGLIGAIYFARPED